MSRAAQGVWDVDRDLPWDTAVDPQRFAAEDSRSRPLALDVSDTAASHWGPGEWDRFAVERRAWQLSQFLHGEQAALLCAARIVETCPWTDARAVAATQVADESRHVAAFSRYIESYMPSRYPISSELGTLLADIITDGRWDVVYLGIQVLVEGTALAAFGRLLRTTSEPLLGALLTRVLADESRHVSFGMISLDEVYQSLSSAELRERQEVALAAILNLASQQFKADLWERMGVPASDATTLVQRSRRNAAFRTEVVARVLPSCRRLGLLDANGGWLVDRLRDSGITVAPPRPQ